MTPKNTLGNIMDGKIESPPYQQTDGFWHYADDDISKCEIKHAVVERADFGRFCNYQGVLCGLSLTLKIENGWCCGWSFESMIDIQQFFNKAQATYLKDLIGIPILIIQQGTCIHGLKINTNMVVDKSYGGHADAISFFVSMNKIVQSKSEGEKKRE